VEAPGYIGSAILDGTIEPPRTLKPKPCRWVSKEPVAVLVIRNMRYCKGGTDLKM